MTDKLHDNEARLKVISEGNFTSKAIKNLTNLSGGTFVVCLLGKTLNDSVLLSNFAQDVVALRQAGVNIIIVHEGGIFLERTLQKLGFRNDAVNNVVLADKDNIEIFEMVLSGHVNKLIVSEINKAGGMAIGISGKDGNLIEGKRVRKIRANKSNIDQILNSSSFGESSSINPDVLLAIEDTEIIPVISPVALNEDGHTLYLEAINVGAVIASSLIASKYIILTDDLLEVHDQIVAEIDYERLNKIMNQGYVSTAMNNILKNSLFSLEHHTECVHIIDSSISHSLLLELLSDNGIGTRIQSSNI